MLTDLLVHYKEVVHGGLTYTNVLMSADGKLYLADFSLSMILLVAQSSNFNSCHTGNVRYMAPEILGLPGEGRVVVPTKAANVYSCGCIMLQLLCGRVPYLWLTQACHITAARIAGIELPLIL
ncbi:kinase-like domain-containing protein [Suillus discolor]|uniref:Kinase-like domain-containing protein n=1 Tax=Suillus discolor TaxID=1912936 RepID=A0A9P7F796_9AGAM|nr:kinase-like domain-containing protein [Suillus discolor]KAG2109407.1 kinase-like domain-containing protein [Suillus discolor]